MLHFKGVAGCLFRRLAANFAFAGVTVNSVKTVNVP